MLRIQRSASTCLFNRVVNRRIVASNNLPPHLLDFISRHVQSVEQLEILLLVSRPPITPWSPGTVYEKILSSPRSVERWLEELTRTGLLERVSDPEGSYRRSQDDQVGAQISTLGEFYRTVPVRVIEAIYKREASAAQSFADAFKIKKTEDQP
jgi:hypothetical protein